MAAVSVTPHQADEPALNAYPVRPEDACLIGRIGGFQGNRRPFAAKAFQSRFLVIDKRDDEGEVVALATAAAPDP